MEEGAKLSSSTQGASPSLWRSALASAVRDVDELWDVLELPKDRLPAARRVAKQFPLMVPRGFLALIQPKNIHDPLLRQIVPLEDEEIIHPDFKKDPLAESQCASVPGLLHKYQGRALLVTTGACAVHCRYCFRRHFPYSDLPRLPSWWQPAYDAIRADSSIEELIFSGGDPLTLPDSLLAEMVRQAAQIPHLQRLRIHSRLPVVLPERIDDSLIAWLTTTRLQPVMVIHANHPQELSPNVERACRLLQRSGVMVLNQSVLLLGVNDSVQALSDLSKKLASFGVLPYYLHLLDWVQGAAHFQVSDERAKEIWHGLAAQMSGWLVPRLVREVPGAAGKTVII